MTPFIAKMAAKKKRKKQMHHGKKTDLFPAVHHWTKGVKDNSFPIYTMLVFVGDFEKPSLEDKNNL